MGAFYPPNWLIFQLPPLQAIDLTRVLHLTFAAICTNFFEEVRDPGLVEREVENDLLHRPFGGSGGSRHVATRDASYRCVPLGPPATQSLDQLFLRLMAGHVWTILEGWCRKIERG